MKRKKPAPGKTAPEAKPTGENTIPFDVLNRLVDLLEERNLDEFEFERAGLRVRLKRRGAAPAPVFESYLPGANQAAGTGEAENPQTEAKARAAAEMGVALEDVHLVQSPIVGTFYAAPRPEAPPFVKLGDRVEVGQVLCIIEAMKLMNEIEADVAGEIVRIYGENGQPVEYGENLFAIRPGKK